MTCLTNIDQTGVVNSWNVGQRRLACLSDVGPEVEEGLDSKVGGLSTTVVVRMGCQIRFKLYLFLYQVTNAGIQTLSFSSPQPDAGAGDLIGVGRQ